MGNPLLRAIPFQLFRVFDEVPEEEILVGVIVEVEEDGSRPEAFRIEPCALRDVGE